MRTTVDIEAGLLQRAKRLALKQKLSLGAVVDQALAAYLGSRRLAEKDPPFALLVRGDARGRFPASAEILAAEEEDDLAALAIPGLKRRAPP